MTIKRGLIVSFILLVVYANSQTVSGVYKINDLLKRTSSPDTTYIINFWAVWCKPCIQELPAFDSLHRSLTGKPMKVLLVSIDFKEDADEKVNRFLQKNKFSVECVLLDEVNGNDYIDKVSTKWSGAIPATLIKHGDRSLFLEKKVHLKELETNLALIDKQ